MRSGTRGNVNILVPELAKYEVGNVLLSGKRLTDKEAIVSLDVFYSLPLEFISESYKLSRETFAIAYKFGITYYDASFLAIAKEYNVTLITENFKHQGKVKGIQVIALKDYQV
ncbi:MAG: type II toxin-antitoxin system VapC family toxin [Patescibacteria group bacterium]